MKHKKIIGISVVLVLLIIMFCYIGVENSQKNSINHYMTEELPEVLSSYMSEIRAEDYLSDVDIDYISEAVVMGITEKLPQESITESEKEELYLYVRQMIEAKAEELNSNEEPFDGKALTQELLNYINGEVVPSVYAYINSEVVPGINAQMEQSESKLESLESAFSIFKANYKTVDQDALKQDIFETVSATISDKVGSTNDSIKSLVDSITNDKETLEKDLEEAGLRLDASESRLDASESRLDASESRLDASEGRLDDFAGRIQDIEGNGASKSDVKGVLLNLSNEYSNQELYNVGDLVSYNGVLYKCLIAVTEAEEFKPEKWQAITIADAFADTQNDFSSINSSINAMTQDVWIGAFVMNESDFVDCDPYKKYTIQHSAFCENSDITIHYQTTTGFMVHDYVQGEGFLEIYVTEVPAGGISIHSIHIENQPQS